MAQLDTAIADTSNNSNGVATLGLSASDPPTQSEVQAVADKLDELILALRRYGAWSLTRPGDGGILWSADDSSAWIGIATTRRRAIGSLSY